MPEAEIPLSDVLREIRHELMTAMKAGEGESLRFEVQDLEIEMQVVVTRATTGEVGGGGSVKFWVLNADASAKETDKYESSQLQKLKLKLRPKTDDGDDSGPVMLSG